jgi:hypothetical protein
MPKVFTFFEFFSARAKVFTSVLLSVTFFAATQVGHAQSNVQVGAQVGSPLIDKLSPRPPIAILKFEPTSVKVGELVTPTLSGIWPDGCAPESAKLTGGPYRMLLSFKLPGPAELILCTAAQKSYRIELPPVKFDLAGRYDIQLVSDRGLIYQPTTLTVNEVGKSFAANNVSGAWYDPKTAGSGLILAHTSTGQIDRLFGTWFFYAENGVPTWLVLQDAIWESPTKVLGSLYQTTGPQIACVLPCSWEARASTKIERVGTFVLNFPEANNGALILTDNNGSARPIVVLERLLPQ